MPSCVAPHQKRLTKESRFSQTPLEILNVYMVYTEMERTIDRISVALAALESSLLCHPLSLP